MAVKSSQQLLYYPQVQSLDLCIARMLFVVFTYVAAFCIFVTVIYLLRLEPVIIDDPIRMILAAIMMALIGFSGGVIAASLIPLFPSVEFLTRTITQPMFFISGVFFTVDMIPDRVKGIALYNPLLQLIEMFRSAFLLNMKVYMLITYMLVDLF